MHQFTKENHISSLVREPLKTLEKTFLKYHDIDNALTEISKIANKLESEEKIHCGEQYKYYAERISEYYHNHKLYSFPESDPRGLTEKEYKKLIIKTLRTWVNNWSTSGEKSRDKIIKKNKKEKKHKKKPLFLNHKPPLPFSEAWAGEYTELDFLRELAAKEIDEFSFLKLALQGNWEYLKIFIEQDLITSKHISANYRKAKKLILSKTTSLHILANPETLQLDILELLLNKSLLLAEHFSFASQYRPNVFMILLGSLVISQQKNDGLFERIEHFIISLIDKNLINKKALYDVDKKYKKSAWDIIIKADLKKIIEAIKNNEILGNDSNSSKNIKKQMVVK
jgi:hypothetical protein